MDETFKDLDELERLFMDDDEEAGCNEEKPTYFISKHEEGPPKLSLEKTKTNQTNSFKEKPKIEKDTKITHFYEKSSVYTDPVFGLRIIKPLINSTTLLERMQGRNPVTFERLKNHVEHGDKTKDWVIGGVIISKMSKTSQKGTVYTLWKLSDLKNDIKTASVMLFRNAHNDLWKTQEGMVVAILNPGILDSKEGGKDQATLSVDSTAKVMILGQSKDMGRCKSRTKAGEPCTAIVNLTDCEYCVYHIKQEYSKASGRSELQSSTGGRGLHDLRNKVLGKNEVFYGGKSYSAIPAKKNQKRSAHDEKRLQSLSDFYQGPGVSNAITRPKAAERLEADPRQRQKDIARLALLKGENVPPISSCSTPLPPLTQPPPPLLAAKASPLPFLKPASPSLSKTGFSFDLKVSSNRQQSNFKAKAAAILKQKPVEKVDPNNIRGTLSGKKRALEDLNRSLEDPEVKKVKLDQEIAKKNRIYEIMNAKSSHTDLIDMKECEMQDKYFSNLEKKEAMEEKMLATTKLACKAVICLTCKYVALSAAERCREEKHEIKIKDAEKRFFKCKNCGNRTVSLQRLPKLPCKSCNGSSWERTSMVKEKIVTMGEKLSIRGDEEAWIGQAGTVNINLLVPEEDPVV